MNAAAIGLKLRNSAAWKGGMAFLHWWKAELVGGLPPRWRDWVDFRPDRLLIKPQDDEWVFWRDHGERDEIGRIRLDDEPEVAARSIQTLLGTFEGDEPRKVFLIEPDKVLRKQVILPAAAEENLQQVLRFEMDRHTPFKADQVYFDHRIVERRIESRTLRVEILVVLRSVVDDILEKTEARGIQLDRIDVIVRGEGLERLEVDLLPEDRRAGRDRRQLTLNLGLAGLFVVILYGVMWQSLLMREQALDDLRARVGRATAEAQQVAALRDRLIEAREAARFLTDKKANHPVIVDVIREVTRLLPDDTWLQRLQVTDGNAILTGQAPEAAGLIGTLEKGDLLGLPVPKGAYTPDPRSGKERFTIETRIQVGDDEEGDDGAAAS